MSRFDAVVVGAGPAGLVVAAELVERGLNVAVYDKGALAEGVVRFPYYMKFFSTAANLELPGFPLIITDEKPTREEYLNYLRRYVQEKRVQVITNHEVKDITQLANGDGFRVSGTTNMSESFEAEAEFVIIATGAYDIPRPLGAPGEELPKVSHFFTEVHPYAMKKVAVVGGRNSAAETALLLWRAGAEVTLIHRGPTMRPLKYWLSPDLENRIRNEQIRAYFQSRITEIRPHEIAIHTSTGETVWVENDFVLAMTGYEPDTDFMVRSGIEVDPVSNRPKHDPATLETNVPGLYVAGVILSGNVSNEIFIENSRHHGALIAESIMASRAL